VREKKKSSWRVDERMLRNQKEKRRRQGPCSGA